MKAITKIFILAAGTGLGIGAGKYMSQMGEKDNKKIKEFLNETEHYYKTKENDSYNKEPNNDDEILKTLKKRVGSIVKHIKKFGERNKASTEDNYNAEAFAENADDYVEDSDENADVEPVEIKPPTKEEEIEWGKNYFSYLLPLTEEAVENTDKENETFDYRYVFEGWMYALDGDCEILLSDFNSIISDIGKAKEELNDEDIEKIFSQWLDYLKEAGIEEYFDSSADENGCVTVTVENRRFYANGRDFKDGEICSVERKPWIYNGSIYYDGILDKPVKAEDSPKEEENE